MVPYGPQTELDGPRSLTKHYPAMNYEIQNSVFFRKVRRISAPNGVNFTGLTEKLPPLELVIVDSLRRERNFVFKKVTKTSIIFDILLPLNLIWYRLSQLDGKIIIK